MSPALKTLDIRDTLDLSQRLLRQLANGVCTFEEFASSLILLLANASEAALEPCTALLSPELARAFLTFLEEHLVKVDFKPCPKPLMVGPFSEDEIEAKKRQLRPKYMRLYELVLHRRQSALSMPPHQAP